ncbi:hypothetical protein CL618_02135 [archaeon]|nr:hypothetical protein [archaeon]
MSLLKISLTISLIGIFILLTIPYIFPVQTSTIQQIKSYPLETKVKLISKISKIQETPGLYILTLKDSNNSIQAIIFKKENLTLKEKQLIEIHGKTTSYKDQTQIQVSLIKK